MELGFGLGERGGVVLGRVGGGEGGAGAGGGLALFFEGEALRGLEFGEGGLEFAGDFLLGVFLGGLDWMLDILLSVSTEILYSIK